jgi:hypothetical protein
MTVQRQTGAPRCSQIELYLYPRGAPVTDRPAGGATARVSEVVPVTQLKSLVDNWILLAQGLIGSIGALALAIG